MNVLIFGNNPAGAREFALMKICAGSSRVDKVFTLGTNAGLKHLGPKIEFVDIHRNFNRVADFCRANAVELVIIGPEQPLGDGLADVLRRNGILAFGPNQASARLESSKKWAVQFMNQHSIPTAPTLFFEDLSNATAALHGHPLPIVVKPDGFTGGKGVKLCDSENGAAGELEALYDANPNAEVLLQEYLPDNPAMPRAEISVHAIVSGKDYYILPTAQDYKPRFDGDNGLMTGGMGCFGPVPNVDMERIEQEIIAPTVAGLHADGHDYRGVIYFGLKITPDGPQVVEYNARFGDPEMVVLCELVSHTLLFDLMHTAASGRPVSNFPKLEINEAVVCVVVVDQMYPDKGAPRPFPKALDTADIYHAATKPVSDGSVLADGGRIAVIPAKASTIADARSAVYAKLDQVNWPLVSLDRRTDIAANW